MGNRIESTKSHCCLKKPSNRSIKDLAKLSFVLSIQLSCFRVEVIMEEPGKYIVNRSSWMNQPSRCTAFLIVLEWIWHVDILYIFWSIFNENLQVATNLHNTMNHQLDHPVSWIPFIIWIPLTRLVNQNPLTSTFHNFPLQDQHD